MSLYQSALKQGVVRLLTLPRLSLPLVLTLGMTLAAVLTVVAIAKTLLLLPLPDIKEESHLYQVSANLQFTDDISVSFLSDLRRVAHLQQQFGNELNWAQFRLGDSNLTINAQQYTVTRINASMGSPEVLGLDLLLGQTTTAEEAKQGIWISNSFWQIALGGRENVLNTTVSMAGKDYPILGVLADFVSVESDDDMDQGYQQVWLFENMQESLTQPETLNITNGVFTLVRANSGMLPSTQEIESWFRGYVKAEISEEQAQQFILSKPFTAEILPYRDAFMGDSHVLVLALLLAMVSLLVMACLNLFNMFIAHYQGRNKEFSIQLCMGSTVQRLRNLIFVENLPMFALATLLGLLAAAWLIRFLPALAGDSLPLLSHIQLDTSSAVVGLATVCIINVLFAFVALIHVKKDSLTDSLNSSGKGTPSQQNQALGRILMVVQLVLACLLLTISLICAKNSFDEVYQSLGFELPNAFEVSMEYADEAWQQNLDEYEEYKGSELFLLRQRMNQRLSSLNAQVLDVSTLPLRANMRITSFPDPETNENRMMITAPVTDGYFAKFGIKLLAGRDINAQDIGTDNVIVDKRLAEERFGSQQWQDIVGKALRVGSENDDVLTVVGVVDSITPTVGSNISYNLPTLYAAEELAGARLTTLVILPEGGNLDQETVATLLRDLDPRLGDVAINSIQSRWSGMTQSARLNMYVVLVMAALTLALAVIGVSGLSQMTAAQKRYEMAVRMATGAKQFSLLKLLLRDAGLMLALGLALGFVVSVFGYQYMAGLIEQLPEFTWSVSAMVALVLALAMLISVAVPSWRTIQSDPMRVLREL